MQKSTITYDFAKEFSPNPGLRFRRLSDKSGEEFREDVLRPLLKKYYYINICADGIETSLCPAFISEAFFDIRMELGNEEFFKRIRLYQTTSDVLEKKFRHDCL